MLKTNDISVVEIKADEAEALHRTVAETAHVANTDNKSNHYLAASWLFLIGSLIFVADAVIEITEGISLHAVLHFSASVLFTIGSVLFIPGVSWKRDSDIYSN